MGNNSIACNFFVRCVFPTSLCAAHTRCVLLFSSANPVCHVMSVYPSILWGIIRLPVIFWYVVFFLHPSVPHIHDMCFSYIPLCCTHTYVVCYSYIPLYRTHTYVVCYSYIPLCCTHTLCVICTSLCAAHTHLRCVLFLHPTVLLCHTHTLERVIDESDDLQSFKVARKYAP